MQTTGNNLRLSKQWKHWCEKAGLRPASKWFKRHKEAKYYLKGHGRYWRVNCNQMLQCGDTYEEFDRWALCRIEEVPLPRTEKEFLVSVKELLVISRLNDVNHQREFERFKERNG